MFAPKAYRMTCPMTKNSTAAPRSQSGQRSCNVLMTKMTCITRYTATQIALMRYRTTNNPVVLVGLSPAQPLNVSRLTMKLIANMAADESRSSHTLKAVPSSYSWKPTNPLTNRLVHSADARPFCTATKYRNAPSLLLPSTPASNTRLTAVNTTYM